MSDRVGLTTLVERACRDFRCGKDLAEFLCDLNPERMPLYGKALVRWIESNIDAIRSMNLYGHLIDLDYSLPIEYAGPPHSAPPEFDFDANAQYLWQTTSGWTAFSESLERVSRIDDFLFTLESDPRCRPLARECRDDLALLNVLADWCEDHERPVAAAEARHLWALVVSLLRE